ncbi:ubiquitin carboxyl-terminal hydrolase 13-like, partial [Trifolium medium]|nr:ubiquitin carboxyl-terminal hydrolase 13-like [Trifolium medium]
KIKFEPNVMCEPIDKKLTFQASQLEDGDIICFQKAPAIDNEEHIRYTDVSSYLEYMHNRQVFSLRFN